MRNFGKAIRLALQYPASIVAAFLCSLAVGVLWGGNIAALYPFVEVVFRGESFHGWMERRVTTGEETCTSLTKSIGDREQKVVRTPDAQRAELIRQLAMERSRLVAEQKSLARSRWCQDLVRRYLPDNPFQNLVLVIGVLVLATVLKSALLVSSIILVERVKQHTMFDLQNEFFARTLTMDVAAFGEHRTSGLLARFTYDLRVLEAGIGALFGPAVREPLKMIACLAGAALISWRLLVVSLLISPVGMLMMRWLSKSMKRTTGQSMDVIAALYSRLSESFNGIKVVKAFTMEAHEQQRLRDTGREYVRRVMRGVTYMALFKPVSEIMGILVVSMACLAGAHLVLNQQTHLFGIRMTGTPLSATDLLIFFAMLAGVADPGRKMSDLYATLVGGVAAADRVYGMMEHIPQVRDPATPQLLPRPHGELTFDHVGFNYLPDQPVLRGVNLRIPFGQTVALIGPNGCGKSTLANLVPRFFDPTSGAVCIDGVDLRGMSLRDLRQRIGLVTQETLLFDDTVMNNIRYGAPQATDEQVVEVARKAHAHRFIVDELDGGYQTNVGQAGGRLSGGQRQRIALARAMLRDPEILILDEATSQIDIESEELIHQALEVFTRGRTAILISHRLSTLTLADRVVVMEGGQILDQGTHEELLGRCKLYRRLFQNHLSEAA
jgi:ATP-binding cassette subfamily B protein/subfamily B ATP-binding cassette protein MsbA